MTVENQARCSSLPATVFQSGGDNLPAKRDLKVATVGTFWIYAGGGCKIQGQGKFKGGGGVFRIMCSFLVRMQCEHFLTFYDWLSLSVSQHLSLSPWWGIHLHFKSTSPPLSPLFSPLHSAFPCCFPLSNWRLLLSVALISLPDNHAYNLLVQLVINWKKCVHVLEIF